MGCVKEATKAMTKMPLIVVFPVMQGLGFTVFMIAWMVYSVNIASMGDFKTEDYEAGSIKFTVSILVSWRARRPKYFLVFARVFHRGRIRRRPGPII